MHVPPPAPSSDGIFAWLVLAALGLRHRHVAAVAALGGPEAVLSLPLPQLAAAFDVRGSKKAPLDDAALLRARGHAEAARAWGDDGGRVLAPSDLTCFQGMPTAPLVVFSRGLPSLLSKRPSLAIVGSRAATQRGLSRARAVAEAAAAKDVVVVSGGALGVDMAAHEGALAAGGSTVVVLGDAARPGKDERPARVRELSSSPERLLTLTPHGPWAPQDKRLWASRNAVIAALADVVVVVEGRARSGTLYTAEAARKLGRPVLAVPGDPDDEVAAAPNRLLRDGAARPLLSVDDALAAVLGRKAKEPAPTAAIGPNNNEEASLLKALGPRGAVLDVEELARRLDAAPAMLWATVLGLELRGVVCRDGSALRRLL